MNKNPNRPENPGNPGQPVKPPNVPPHVQTRMLQRKLDYLNRQIAHNEYQLDFDPDQAIKEINEEMEGIVKLALEEGDFVKLYYDLENLINEREAAITSRTFEEPKASIIKRIDDLKEQRDNVQSEIDKLKGDEDENN